MWKYLFDKACDAPGISSQWDDARERLANPELSDEELEEQVWRVMTPNFMNHISTHYANLLKLWHFAKHDKTHKKIMATKRKLMNEEDFDPEEAIEHAVKKRRFLIMKATPGMLGSDIVEKVPAPRFEEEEEEDEN